MVATEREVRIAVVMYGGTSLAIYMNGTSQEFLHLVRATSRAATAGTALRGTARVYRKLAYVLAGKRLSEIDDALLDDEGANPPVRFVIDIVSGTSAGGINSVMLAKALARNTDLAPLKQLWLDEGAIDRLVNDPRSASRRYPYREPVRSLFNSDRMYVEVLNALAALNPVGQGGTPLVDDLTLVVTGTDLDGDPIDIQLADGVAQEYDHKHTFEFRLRSSPKVDDFTAEYDPLLAFAARTTSSLPAVFEPSTVAAARELAGGRAKAAKWEKLFRSLRDEDLSEQERHAFADGGYLDNKPFGHAIDLLAHAPTGVHVTRKLYYLEPQPQRIERDAPRGETPNALTNTLKVVTLARYETIRADIERLTDRNRLLERVRTLGLGVVEDIAHRPPEEPQDDDLQDITEKYGPAYGGYHRLRVATLTDSLADTLADHAGVAPSSDLRRAIRMVVRAWRSDKFARNVEEGDGREREADFLKRFDVPYDRRRAVFCLSKMNQLLHLDDTVAKELRNLTGRAPAGSFPAIKALLEQYASDRKGAHITWSGIVHVLGEAKRVLSEAVVMLDARRPLPNDTSGFMEELEGLDPWRRQMYRDQLKAILEAAPGADAESAARALLERDPTWIEGLARSLEGHQAGRRSSALAAVNSFENIRGYVGLDLEVQALLDLYWVHFRHFDMVQFPLIEATGIGDELSPVEIHRMSPVDAAEHLSPAAGDKLMGTRFASFGAFLDRGWRESDIRWGRLDGAERLITTLLGREYAHARDGLVVEAHLAILHEEFPADRAAIDALAVPADALPDDLDRARANIARFLSERKPNPHLDPQESATTLSRLLRTSNKLVDTLTTESRAPRALRNAIALTSLAGSELIEAAIPKSFKSLLLTYWANLLLVFGALLVALAVLLPGDSLYRVGPRLGGLLVAVGATALLGRSLLWRLLRPPARAAEGSGSIVAARRLGSAALIAGLIVVAMTALLEWRAGSQPRDLLGYPTVTMAIASARTGGEVACMLGASTALPGCVTPGGATGGAAVDAVRGLVVVDFAFVALYVSMLAFVGLAAIRTGALGLGLLGITLATTAGFLDVVENVRLLRTLAIDYVAMDEAWLQTTTHIARAKFLAAFAAVAVLLPTLDLHARTALLNMRMATWALMALGAGGVALGMVGLVLDHPSSLASGLGLLVVVTLVVAVLLMVGHIPVPARGAPNGEATVEPVTARRAGA
jgi:patatin-related protein